MPSVADIHNEGEIYMTQQDKDNLQHKQLTDSLIIGCLTTCESVISKNAYLEKKWKNCYRDIDYYDGGYGQKRLQWMAYREKLRSILADKYSMKQIIQLTKSNKDKATQKAVEEVIRFIDSEDYTLCL